MISVVAHCPVCNGPIYGPTVSPETTYGGPSVKYSCVCRTHLLLKIDAETDLVRAQAEVQRSTLPPVPEGQKTFDEYMAKDFPTLADDGEVAVNKTWLRDFWLTAQREER